MMATPKGQAKEPLSSWERWTRKSRPDPELKSPKSQEAGEENLQQENQEPLGSDIPVEQLKENVSLWETPNSTNTKAWNPCNLEDSSFSEQDEAALLPQREYGSPPVDDESAHYQQPHRLYLLPTPEATHTNGTEATKPSPSSNQYPAPAEQRNETSVDDTLIHQDHEPQHQATTPETNIPPSLPPILGQHAAQAIPLTQDDLDIYALISNVRSQPLPDAEAGSVDTDVLASYLAVSEREEEEERQREAQQFEPNLEISREGTGGEESHQQRQRGKRSSHQTNILQAESTVEQRTQSSTECSKRRHRDRDLKPSPLTLTGFPLVTEPWTIGYQSRHQPPLPPPLPLSTLSLQERLLLSRVRARILSLPEPEYEAWKILFAKPEWGTHPFYCDAGYLASEYGFAEPKSEGDKLVVAGTQDCSERVRNIGGATDSEKESSGANGEFANSVIALCELQEHLAAYMIRYREGGHSDPESRSVSPKTVEADQEMVLPLSKPAESAAKVQAGYQDEEQMESQTEENPKVSFRYRRTPAKNLGRKRSRKERTPTGNVHLD